MSADEDYARLGTASAPKDASKEEITTLTGTDRPAVLARADDVNSAALEERVEHLNLTLAAAGTPTRAERELEEELHVATATGRKGAGLESEADVTGGGVRGGGRGRMMLRVHDAHELDAATGLGLAPEDVADKPELYR